MMMLDTAQSDPDVEIHFLNVGQGDATLMIDHTQRTAAVIDCNRAGEQPVESLLRNADVPLEAAFVSHFHADHFDAIPNILGRRASTAVYCNHSVVHLSNRDQRAQVRAFKRWLADEKSKGRARDTVGEGDGGTVGLIAWKCLAPNTQLLDSAEGYASENRASIVLLLTLPSLTVLVGADADAIVWQHLIKKYSGPVDVLRVPHHGGPVVPGGLVRPQDILAAYRPRLTVVSVGTSNRYGHATPPWLRGVSVNNRVLCTQVTRACHNALSSTPHSCAGDVTVQWWKNGEWRVLPDSAPHMSIVKGWDHPQCISSTP